MASDECTIQVHVRRTGEIVSIKVIPLLTTYGDIIKIICEQINESEPSHYYLALNYQTEMQDHMVFEPRHQDQRFQLIMRTQLLLEYIAERSLQRQQIKPKIRQLLDTDSPTTEVPQQQSVVLSTTNSDSTSRLNSLIGNIMIIIFLVAFAIIIRFILYYTDEVQ